MNEAKAIIEQAYNAAETQVAKGLLRDAYRYLGFDTLYGLERPGVWSSFYYEHGTGGNDGI